MIDDILNDIDFSNTFKILDEFILDCKIKKFRRKFRRNGRIIYTKYLITYNPVRDLFIDNLSFNLKMINRRNKKLLDENEQSN